MNKEFFAKNRSKLIEKLEDNSIVILFAGKAPKKSADEAYTFTPNRNFYYLNGIDKANIISIIIKSKTKVEENIFIEKSDPVMEKWVGKTISEENARELSGINEIYYLEDFDEKIHKIINAFNIENIYLDLERDSWKDQETYVQIYAKTITMKYPQLRIKNVYPEICRLRTIKSDEEISEIKEAIRVTGEGIKNLIRNAKPGMKEYFDFILKSNGIKDFAFKTIAASGKNATVLHYSENSAIVREGELVLLDLGAQHNYYNGDISRTFPISGKFTDRQKQIYNIVLKSQLNTINSIKAGISFKELNVITRKTLLEELSKIGLAKDDTELSNYYYHGVSHFLGLDTHDVGERDTLLKAGMILTVEPGLYIEEECIGIRIEDNILVTEDGYINLSENIIKTVEDIEAFMSSNV
jgi:Xaa-Pro aminopeptidase